MRDFKKGILAAFATLTLAVSPALAAGQTARPVSYEQTVKKVRKELVTLPYTGVFDNLAYKVEGDTVTLYGQVVRPSTRKDAERRVRRVAGVARVVNQIEVLPLSSFDDSIRVSTYRELYRAGGLYRYFLGANPSVRIIVNRGHVTLEGFVANEGDRRLAGIIARGVPGSFSVTNNLRTDDDGRRY